MMIVVLGGILPLKYLIGFDNYCAKVVLNAKQGVIIIFSRFFKISYSAELDAAIKITKIKWKVRHIIPEDHPTY